MQRIIKHSAEFSKKDLSDMLDQNEQLRLFLKKSKDYDDKKLK